MGSQEDEQELTESWKTACTEWAPSVWIELVFGGAPNRMEMGSNPRQKRPKKAELKLERVGEVVGRSKEMDRGKSCRS